MLCDSLYPQLALLLELTDMTGARPAPHWADTAGERGGAWAGLARLERGGVGRGGAEAVARAAEGPTRPQSPAHLRPHNHLLSPLCIIIVF